MGVFIASLPPEDVAVLDAMMTNPKWEHEQIRNALVDAYPGDVPETQTVARHRRKRCFCARAR